jgi:hypothetical protein
MHRQKVAEVEKLTQTVRELEEAVLAGGAAANAVRDYQRKVQEMNVIHEPWCSEHALCFVMLNVPERFIIDVNFKFCFSQEEMKTLDRELARAKVSANRVAVVVANEWKDGNDKVMPVKQWLDERRLLQVSNKCLVSFSLILLPTCSQLILNIPRWSTTPFLK